MLIRPLEASDDLAALTRLIHAAYAVHAHRGLRYWGTHQSVEDTASRVASGSTFVLASEAELRGTITVRRPQPDSPVPTYREPRVFTLCQFCVAPSLKGQGWGRRLHQHAISYAQSAGAEAVALDTAEPATALIALYKSWGYSVVGACDWRPHTNYPSIVMAMRLAPGGSAP